jgi:hypothetical protein
MFAARAAAPIRSVQYVRMASLNKGESRDNLFCFMGNRAFAGRRKSASGLAQRIDHVMLNSINICEAAYPVTD